MKTRKKQTHRRGHTHSHTQKSNSLYFSTFCSDKKIKKKEGWKIIEIKGNAYQRGFSHGKILYKDLCKVCEIFPFIVKTELSVSYEKYIQTCRRLIKPTIIKYYPEFYEEMTGIVEGALSKGTNINIDIIIAWNSVPSFYDYFGKTKQNRCTAFIATGSATTDGKIVMGHNTHCDFVTAQTQNIIIYVYPTNGGHPFVMQTSPGFIASGTDWFISSNGIIGCETTISELKHKPKFNSGVPYFCRIRQAMQYGKSLDDYTKIMLKNNAGDYACSWMFGNIHTNEIMLFDLGIESHNIEKKKDGFFYGMNTPLNAEFRKKETNDEDIYDVRTSSGSRNLRLQQLLSKTKKINVSYAKEILSDHYDIYENKQHLNGSSICKHGELEEKENVRKSFFPYGCTDGKVVNYEMAKKMKFIGRFGSCCGRVFDAGQFVKKHPIYKPLKKYLPDFSYTDWAIIVKPKT